MTLDLPAETQWEYACMAKTTTALNSGKNLTDTKKCQNVAEVGRYWHNGGLDSTPDCGISHGTDKVGSYLPNQWGLYDMHGNVSEWSLDWYQKDLGSSAQADPRGPDGDSYRVFCGGSWFYFASACRSASRDSGWVYGNPYNHVGFRLAMTVQ
ncbi:MAG: formylglycine-generating enzyme family protein [Lentisphaerae bacterium]|nr:formylglycine-generating enzyme family protein [Lentisphaerota bacterium]